MTEPTIVLHLWWTSDVPEYWYSRFPPIGLPRRTWFEPIGDEL